MIEIINLEKLDNDGRKQPANDPTSSTPDNITHCQLRYNTFTSSYVIQGVAVTGASSTFEFTVSDALFYWKFKLYTSTDGTNYTEKKSYGGSLGKHLFDSSPRRMLITVQAQGTDTPVLLATKFNNTGKLVTTLSRTGLGNFQININNTDSNIYFKVVSAVYLSASTYAFPPIIMGHLAGVGGDFSGYVKIEQTDGDGILADDTVLYDGADIEILMYSLV